VGTLTPSQTTTGACLCFSSSHRFYCSSSPQLSFQQAHVTNLTFPELSCSISHSFIATSTLSNSCTSLCPGETWTFSSNLLARWTFDRTLADTMNNYQGTTTGNLSFASNGYVNQALLLSATANQSVTAPYIPLANTSFTVEAWIKPTLLTNNLDHSILGLCASRSSYQCLHLLLRRNGSNFFLYFGHFSDDCQGSTSVSINQWIHAAFVFDLVTMRQSIYLNGRLDGSRTASAPFMGTQGNVTIGSIPLLNSALNGNFFEVSRPNQYIW
jgi:hypothetical protein